MFTLLPFILIIGSLVVIIAILLRRLPQLSAMQVDTLQKEKTNQVKKKILDERLKRQLSGVISKAGDLGSSMKNVFSNSFNKIKDRLEEQQADLANKRMEENLENVMAPEEKQEILEDRLEEIVESIEDDTFEVTEKKLIDIISADSKNVDAYFELGNLYASEKMYQEATETLSYALSLDTSRTDIMLSLAELFAQQGQYHEAASYMKQALSIEDRNPKFLDLHIEFSIAAKDPTSAQESLDVLKIVNPENGKISQIEEDINNLMS